MEIGRSRSEATVCLACQIVEMVVTATDAEAMDVHVQALGWSYKQGRITLGRSEDGDFRIRIAVSHAISAPMTTVLSFPSSPLVA